MCLEERLVESRFDARMEDMQRQLAADFSARTLTNEEALVEHLAATDQKNQDEKKQVMAIIKGHDEWRAQRLVREGEIAQQLCVIDGKVDSFLRGLSEAFAQGSDEDPDESSKNNLANSVGAAYRLCQ